MKQIASRSKLFKLVMSFILLTVIVLLSGNGFSQDNTLKLNDKDYFTSPAFDVLVFENEYNGMFFDEKTSGILLIHHGVRTATGGALRMKPTPEQWDQIPTVIERKVNKETNSIDVLMRYKDLDFDSRLHVEPQGSNILISIILDQPLPQNLEGRAGLNIEFLPTEYFEKTYLMDGKSGVFPLYPSGPMEVKPAATQIQQFAGHFTYDDRGRGVYTEVKPFATGKTLILAPEAPERRLQITSLDGELGLHDGRNVAQNGWYVVRQLIPANKSGKVAEWLITPNRVPNWVRTPNIGFSQLGYLPKQEKRAVIELDPNDKPLKEATLLKLNDKGQWVEALRGAVKEWGKYTRYHYVTFDFTPVQETGLYTIQYGAQKTEPFQIGAHIFDNAWQQTLDVWFPVQMDHMFVNEGYRVWHGAAHLDDARQAPLNHQHFDGFQMGESTETQYQPGEHVPGLNIGGWFDAGDYDIRTGSHCQAITALVNAWEQFKIDRDETLVDQKQRYVDIHHPDGAPDILQQIEHGILAQVAQHRAFGRAATTIVEAHLHQYHHLGDAVNITDNLVYNPKLKMYESDGFTSGTPDDRWVFTNKTPFNNYASIGALAAASRALRGYNDALAEECLTLAKKAWQDEQAAPPPPTQTRFRFGGAMELEPALQLFIATKDKQYSDIFQEKLWPAMERGSNFMIETAVSAVPYMDKAYREKLAPYVKKYKEANDEIFKQNPYGVTIGTGGWAGNGGIVDWACTNYQLHKAFPEIISAEYTLRGISYILGCHPYSNVSFVSGVGTRSKKYAYGNNRADFSFIAGGVVPGVLVLKPDFPEHMEDWPFLWGENEYVIDICAQYVFLANAALDLSKTLK